MKEHQALLAEREAIIQSYRFNAETKHMPPNLNVLNPVYRADLIAQVLNSSDSHKEENTVFTFQKRKVLRMHNTVLLLVHMTNRTAYKRKCSRTNYQSRWPKLQIEEDL